MLRFGAIDNKRWAIIISAAARYTVHDAHPAKLAVSPQQIIYWHADGLEHGYWHAIITRDPETTEVTLSKGEDPRARSEIDAFRFIDALLDLGDNRGTRIASSQAIRKANDEEAVFESQRRTRRMRGAL